MRAVLGLTREGALPLLGEDTSVAELLDVAEGQHAMHHLMAPHLLKCLEVEVPKPLVPAPCLTVAAGGE